MDQVKGQGEVETLSGATHNCGYHVGHGSWQKNNANDKKKSRAILELYGPVIPDESKWKGLGRGGLR